MRKFIFTWECTRASKFRFPDSTDATTRSLWSIASEICAGSGPLLPIQEVQPYPTVWKRSASRSPDKPDRFKYCVTTFEPGARLVLTHDLVLKPFSNAFRATRPAPIMTEGFEVLVQLVMAAMTMLPSLSV